MLKLSVTLLLALCFKGETVTSEPILDKEILLRLNNPLFRSNPNDALSELIPHIMEFVELIDVEKVVAVAFGHLEDPDVINFIRFIFSPQFKELVWEFESIAEFKEAFIYLASQGYELEFIIDYINSALNLPLFGKPEVQSKSGKGGVSGLIDDLIAALPMEEIRELFESKLENSPEIAALFETINSEEFMDIMKRMSQNPKLTELKAIFESYGFDFQYICTLSKEIFGVYYQGIFCN